MRLQIATQQTNTHWINGNVGHSLTSQSAYALAVSEGVIVEELHKTNIPSSSSFQWYHYLFAYKAKKLNIMICMCIYTFAAVVNLLPSFLRYLRRALAWYSRPLWYSSTVHGTLWHSLVHFLLQLLFAATFLCSQNLISRLLAFEGGFECFEFFE